MNRYKEAEYPVVWVLRKLHQEDNLTPEQAQLMVPERPEEQLYNLDEDPYEVTNLAESPEHQTVLQEMRAVLGEWIDETDDQGCYFEDSEVVEFYDKRSENFYAERIEALRRKWGLTD